VISRPLGTTGLGVSRLGFGLAAIGRPGYVTLGRARDLPADRSEAALSARALALLDAARDAGVHYFDVARSYGQAEHFLGAWLAARNIAPRALTIGSKWGYAYTAGWQVTAAVHEQKELSLARFTQQLAESRAELGPWLDLYQIHSAILASGCLDDAALLAALVEARRHGHYRAIGLTLSGPTSRQTLDRALTATVDGERVFDVVQATFNLLEPSLASLLAAAGAAGLGVIVKEVHANGRLTALNDRPVDRALVSRLSVVAQAHGLTVDQLAVAFAAAHPWVDCVLSGAATVAQLASHVVGCGAALPGVVRDELAAFAEPPATYWQTRGSLVWN
jgi:aryl-alcohol dehydrogenase-like predicted oxidoreductase